MDVARYDSVVSGLGAYGFDDFWGVRGISRWYVAMREIPGNKKDDKKFGRDEAVAAKE